MPEEKSRRSVTALLVVVQLVLVPLTSLVLGWLALLAVELIVSQFSQTPRDDGLAYVAYGSLGFIAGYALQRSYPWLSSSGGRWTWFLPFLLLGWGVIDSLRRGFEIRDIFAPGLKPEAGWAFMLITMPTVASLFYSIGVVFADRRRPRMESATT